ncbi:MAG: CDP-glucose 4,6-dehydratase [Cohaesibacteraceae bacterium]
MSADLQASRLPSPDYWAGKRVLLTGHTGFKGSWCALMLQQLGASVFGYALAPADNEAMFDLASVADRIDHRIGDIRDAEKLEARVRTAEPDVVIHMAAQALVRPSYSDPRGTYETNVLGTLNLLEALKQIDHLIICLVVTSDKVYANDESGRIFSEDDPLGGHDPYSASKAACEILTASWRDSFADDQWLRVATARAGNVIGGGDFAQNRIVPDVWRAHRRNEVLILRNPGAVRPWQHVLDCLNGYLLFIEHLADDFGPKCPRSLNFGPAISEAMTVGKIAEKMAGHLNMERPWELALEPGPPEMHQLSLDSSAARSLLRWNERFGTDSMIDMTASWYSALSDGRSMADASADDVDRFLRT